MADEIKVEVLELGEIFAGIADTLQREAEGIGGTPERLISRDDWWNMIEPAGADGDEG